MHARPVKNRSAKSVIRRRLSMLIAILLLGWLVLALLEAFKPMPKGLSFNGPWRPAEDVRLLLDQTHPGADGQPQSEQEIFDALLALIRQAERLVVLDMFLFNDFAGQSSFRALSHELAQALIQAKQRSPELEAVLITDPFNTLYGGMRNPQLERLKAAGVHVIKTPLAQLPASNPLWSGPWSLCCRGLGNSTEGGWLPNPVAPGKVSLRTYLHLLNFRANHRKTLVADSGNDWIGLVTSGNPHDASSRHSNQAMIFKGAAALDLLASEQAVARLAGYDTRGWPSNSRGTVNDAGDGAHLRVLTEGAVRDALLDAVRRAGNGDRLSIEVFYASFRPLAEALIAARQRGVHIRVLLDPNRDAFGREKNGIPNRQFAWDLHQAGIDVRWCATSGEQCHRKMLLLNQGEHAELLNGSANFTRRNLDDLNLETDVHLRGPRQTPALARAGEDFQGRWSNADGATRSLPYEAFADHSHWRYGLYRVMEASGLSTF